MSPHSTSILRRAFAGRFGWWIKAPYALFVGAVVPVYGSWYGPANFLWFSDIALFGVLLALWFELRLIAGMMALSVLLPEIAWSIGFLSRVLGGADIFGLAGYMFDPAIPSSVRALSLFHLALPPLLAWMLYRLGYDSRALPAQTLLAAAVLIASRAAATEENNINWVLGLGPEVPPPGFPAWLWLALLWAAHALLLYVPTHLLLRRLFRTAHGDRPRTEASRARTPRSG